MYFDDYELTSGTDLIVYKKREATTITYYPHMTYYPNKPEEYDSEFEFAEKKRKPHHIRKKKGWEI